MSDLLPCPFCGGAARLGRTMDESLWSHDTVEYQRVQCDECDSGTPWLCPGQEHAAVELWNMRAEPKG